MNYKVCSSVLPFSLRVRLGPHYGPRSTFSVDFVASRSIVWTEGHVYKIDLPANEAGDGLEEGTVPARSGEDIVINNNNLMKGNDIPDYIGFTI